MRKHPYKMELTLILLLARGKGGLNQPEAHRAYGESCLNTMVSLLRNEHMIQVKGKTEPWIHRHGGKTSFTRYYLDDLYSEKAALELLEHYRSKRGLESSTGHFYPPFDDYSNIL